MSFVHLQEFSRSIQVGARETNVENVQVVEEALEVSEVDDSVEEVDLEEGEVSESDDEISIVRIVPNTQAEKMNSRFELITVGI